RQCAAAAPMAGSTVDGPALRDCLHTLLQVWVDRWGPNPQPLRPNILFILSDDQRWDTTDGKNGLSGAEVMPRTRAELADQGVEFNEAFMTTPLCCPSRSSILSGQLAHRTGVYKNGGNNGGADDFDDTSTLAIWLQNAGYRTSLIGKYLNGYNTPWDTSLDQIRIDQLEMLQAVDEAIGGSTTFGITGIMQILRDLGVADRTFVLYFSDNGWLWGEHRLRAKNQPYEESIRAPMFVRYPPLAPLPRKEGCFALNIDLASTFAELAGAGVPIFQDGRSLVRVIDGTQPAGTWR